ncbi:hypothetical protein ACLB2K_057276 [Fragaria x ananassa]
MTALSGHKHGQVEAVNKTNIVEILTPAFSDVKFHQRGWRNSSSIPCYGKILIDYEALNLRIEQEQHIRDESSAYDLLYYFFKLILNDRQRNLAEAVSCLVFASSRLTCGVIPKLGEIRDLFGERYEESFVDTAVKLLPGNLVNPTFKKNIIALCPPDSEVPTDVIVKHELVKPSFTSSSPDQAPARSSEQKKDDKVQCPKHVHPKLPDWDDIYTQFNALKKPKYVNPKLPDIAAKINALNLSKNENTADNYQLQLQYHEDHGSVDDGAIFSFHGCRNSIERIEFEIQQYCY